MAISNDSFPVIMESNRLRLPRFCPFDSTDRFNGIFWYTGQSKHDNLHYNEVIKTYSCGLLPKKGVYCCLTS